MYDLLRVWFLPPLLLSSSSCNKQHEGGCNWEVRGSARWNHLYLNAASRSLSLKISPAYCISATLSPTLYWVSLPLSLITRVAQPLLATCAFDVQSCWVLFYILERLSRWVIHCLFTQILLMTLAAITNWALKETSQVSPLKDVPPPPNPPFPAKQKCVSMKSFNSTISWSTTSYLRFYFLVALQHRHVFASLCSASNSVFAAKYQFLKWH